MLRNPKVLVPVAIGLGMSAIALYKYFMNKEANPPR